MKAVHIVTRPEVANLDDAVDACMVSNILRQKGYDIPMLEHLLLHRYKKTNGVYFKNEKKERPLTGYGTTICNGEYFLGGGLYYDKFDVLERLHYLAKIYIGQFKPPYTVLTYCMAYERVAEAFADLGCDVRRIARNDKKHN